MHLVASYGFLALAIWLIITGILHVFSIGNPTVSTLLAILSVIAGVLILLGK